jgi:DNA-binding SARP family transcriptional activator
MEFQVLGPLQVRQDDQMVEVGTAPKLRLMLAVLLSHADRPVSVATLTSVLWGEIPPLSARKNIQLYAHQLRRTLGADFLVHRGGAYSVITGDGLDAALFARLAAEGSSLLEADNAAEAYHRLNSALRLWRGAAYTGFLEYPSVAAEAVHLEHLRLTALEQRAEAGLATGRDAELVIELTEMLETNPYRERLRAHLMLALYRSGRQVEAFELFRHTRALLNDALGVEPGPALQRLHQAMLRGDQELVPAQRTLSPGHRGQF